MYQAFCIPTTLLGSLLLMAVPACGHERPTPNTPEACRALGSMDDLSALPVANTDIRSAVFQAATATRVAHCQVDGAINARTGVHGQKYAVNFRLRLPLQWNERFFMGGGGGTNGTLVDPVTRLALGYATVGTDSGHDNTINNDPNAGGTATFGTDPQARIDFAYNAYDVVTRTAKAITALYFGQSPKFSYFQGCSEGGREAMLMSQRFPTHYDGIIAGDPVLHIPLGPMAGIHTTQLFAGLATRQGQFLANGQPAIGKTYSDMDLMLVRSAILNACDRLDGLVDGIVDNMPACTRPLVHAQLLATQCTEGKIPHCLTADQIQTLERAYEGVVDSKGTPLYSDWPWDPGISGQSSATTYNPSWRSWWLGSASATANSAIKLSYVSAVSVIYNATPVLPFTSADAFPFSMAYNFDTDVARIYATSAPGVSPAFNPSAAAMLFTDATDLTAFQQRGGRMMLYQGGADSSVSLNDTLRWYTAMNSKMGGTAHRFARMYVVPGMNHCSGGPATDSFDMLPHLVNWVEGHIAPDSVIAHATTPAYFNVAARSRPLCPYPKQSRYLGAGDINVAANFSCQ